MIAESRSDSLMPDGHHNAKVELTSTNSRCHSNPSTVHDRIFRTACLYISFGMLGLASPIIGNTILHLEKLFDTDTATISVTFTVHMAGYLTGSVLCGFIYDKVNHELAFGIVNLVEGLATIAAPFFGQAGGLLMFVGTMAIQAVSQGYVDAGGQSYTVELWVGHRYREPILQAAHALWSMGGTIAPFIIACFLVDLPKSHMDNSTSFNDSIFLANTTTASSLNGITSDPFSTDVAKVRFAYVAIGSLISVAGILFFIAYGRNRSWRVRRMTECNEMPVTATISKSHHEDFQACDGQNAAETLLVNSNADANKASSTKKWLVYDWCLYISFIVLIFFYYHLYLYVELVPISYLTTFTVKYLGFSIGEASLLMSVFYGLHFAGRLLGVPLSVWLRPRTMVIIDLSFTAAAYLILLMFVQVWPAVVWLSAAMAGLAMATTFATGVLWISETIPVTGSVAAVMIVGYALGGMLGPQFVGRLFESTPMWFVYVIVAASVGHLLLYFGMLFYAGRHRNRLQVMTSTSATVTTTLVDSSDVSLLDKPSTKATAPVRDDVVFQSAVDLNDDYADAVELKQVSDSPAE